MSHRAPRDARWIKGVFSRWYVDFLATFSMMITLQDPPSIDQLSERSTPAVPNSVFHATDFLLGAGAVIIQPATGNVVLVTDKRERWFLPKGRKDKGESLEQTVLREAYEEVRWMDSFLPPSDHSFRAPSRVLMSDLAGPRTLTHPPFIPDGMDMHVFSHSFQGSLLTRLFLSWMIFDSQTGYRIQFLPLYTGSLAPDPRLPSKESLPVKDTEPIAVTTFNWPEGHPHLGRFGGGEYFTTWFVGQIAEDAVSWFCFFATSIAFLPAPSHP
jgi:hypothetical protein